MADASNGDRRTEIERILKLATEGKLTPAQAADLIAALDAPAAHGSERAGDADPDEPFGKPFGEPFEAAFDTEPDAEPSKRRREERDERRRRRRHGHRRQHGWGAFASAAGGNEDLADDIERAVELGTRTLRSVFRSSFGRSSFWDEASNHSVLSHAMPPTGTDFRCEGNQFAVSNVNNVRLTRSTFSNNHVNAADVAEIELVDSRFEEQHVRGSSLRQLLGENAEIRANELNGAQWSRMTIGKGRLEGNLTNGSQLRDVGISESVLEDSRFNGTKLKTLVINADSHVKELSLDGVLGRNWLLEGAAVSDSRFSGMRVDGLVLKRSGLDGVVFARQDYSPRLKARGLGMMRDFQLNRVMLRNCSFVDCVFDGTRFEGFEASDLQFDGVDFTGLTITSTGDLERLAGDRRVA